MLRFQHVLRTEFWVPLLCPNNGIRSKQALNQQYSVVNCLIWMFPVFLKCKQFCFIWRSVKDLIIDSWSSFRTLGSLFYSICFTALKQGIINNFIKWVSGKLMNSLYSFYVRVQNMVFGFCCDVCMYRDLYSTF